MSDFKDLEVWQKAVDVVTSVYQITSSFPESEKFGLVNQLRRAAVSIPSNIAEGSARHHAKDFIHFLRIILLGFKKSSMKRVPNSKMTILKPEKSIKIRFLSELVSLVCFTMNLEMFHSLTIFSHL